MKKWLPIVSMIFICFNSLKAQVKGKSEFYLGGYYTFLIDPVILESTGDTVQLRHQYFNINLRYALSYKWRIGAEYILVLTSPEEVKDPFYIAGLTVDYDILRVKKSKLHVRVGLSLSDIVFAGDFEPKRRTVINRIIGASYEFRVTKAFWIYAGYYNHFPINKIPYKYSIAQPFIGICFGLTKSKL